MLIFLFASGLTLASEIKINGYIDTYYAYDFNKPESKEREFTTQPARHNEFNINLAHIDMTLNKSKTRGRFAMQTGNSVTKNYIAEPTSSVEKSGGNDLKNIQESYIGIKIHEKTWIDFGIFFGNIGMESWISKDNFNYSRALASDYTPYYSNGLRVEHHLNEKNILQIQVLNGWQNITETNDAKSFAFQWKKILNSDTEFYYNNFLGDERIVSLKDRFRHYHDFVLKTKLNEFYEVASSVDIGFQSQQEDKGVDSWGVATIAIKRNIDELKSLGLRLEHYLDSHQSNIITNSENGFQVSSVTLTWNQFIENNTIWRVEARSYHSKDKIYHLGEGDNTDNDGFLATSIASAF